MNHQTIKTPITKNGRGFCILQNMHAMLEKLERIKNLNINKLMFKIWSEPYIQEFIIQANQDQLFLLGEDSNGVKLYSFSPAQPYSPFTIKEKRLKGQPTDRLTLKDTGDFYDSFVVIPALDGFIQDADAEKDDTNLFEQYGVNVLGLNEFNMDRLSLLVTRELIDLIVSEI
jgi:hypothetical protein